MFSFARFLQPPSPFAPAEKAAPTARMPPRAPNVPPVPGGETTPPFNFDYAAPWADDGEAYESLETSKRSSKTSLDDGKVTHTRTSEDITEDEGGSTSVKKSKGFEAGTDGAKVSMGKETEAKQGDASVKRSTETAVSFDKDGPKVSRTWGDNVGDEEGSSGTKKSITVGPGSAEGSLARSSTDAAGTTTKTAGTVTAEWEKGQYGGGVDHTITDKDGNKTGGVAAKGTVDIDGGGLHGASGEMTASHGKVSVTLKGGYRVEASEPKKTGERWVVTWRRTREAGAGVGAKGKHGGVKVGATDSDYEMGSRTFSSEAEAKAFHDDAASLTHSMGDSPTTLEGAFHLAIGESRGVGSQTGISGGVDAKVSGVEMGLNGSDSKTDELEVRRMSANIFEVTVSHGSNSSLGGSLGGFGVAAKAGGSEGESQATTVRFDLTTAEGKKAFEEYTRTRKVPEKGGKVVAYEEGKEVGSYDGLDLGGLSTSRFAGRAWEKVRWDEQGKHEVYGGQQSEDMSITRVGKWLTGDKDSHKSFDLVGSQEDDVDQDYLVRGTFSGESGKSNADGMYRLTGRNDSRPIDEIRDTKSSGTWQLTAQMSKEQVDEYCTWIAKQRDFGGPALELQEAVRNAKDSDDKMRAVSMFMKAKGSKALRALGAHDLTFDVELEKDPNFPGRTGRLEHEAKVAKYTSLLQGSGANGPAILPGLEKEIAGLEERRKAVADEKRYTDLPSELRAEEVAKIDSAIIAYQALKSRAVIETIKNRPGEDAEHLMARQIADDKGKGEAPKDPQQRQLYDLRDHLTATQMQLEELQRENAQARAAVLGAMKHLRSGDIAEGLRDSRRDFEVAEKLTRSEVLLDSSATDLRLAFVKSLGDPQAALATGAGLRAQLDQQLAMVQEANVYWLGAAMSLKSISNPAFHEGPVWKSLEQQP